MDDDKGDDHTLEGWFRTHISDSPIIITTPKSDTGKYEGFDKILGKSISLDRSSEVGVGLTRLDRLKQKWEDEIRETKETVIQLRTAKEDRKLKESVFDNKQNEQEYISLLKKKYAENNTSLTDVTFICISGINGAGKDTFADCVFQTNTTFDIEQKRVAFARSLKESCASIFQMDLDLLANRSEEARLWMECETSDDALFWTACLMKSLYVKQDLPVYHKDGEDVSLYSMSDEQLEISLSDENFRKKYPGIHSEYNALAKENDADVLIPEFIKAKKRYINECRESLLESREMNSNSTQFIDALRAQDITIDSQKFPFTPRKMLKDVGTNIFRKQYCDDIFVLSEIRRIIKIKQAQTVKKPIVVVLPDARYINEVLLPCKFGAKIIFAYIEREDVLAKNPALKKLDSFIEDTIPKECTGVFKRSVPSIAKCREALASFVNQINLENTANGLPKQELPSDVDWMPIYLKFYMRENFGAKLRDYNFKNMMDVSYFRILNKHTNFSDKSCLSERINTLFKNYFSMLQQSNVFNTWSYKI